MTKNQNPFLMRPLSLYRLRELLPEDERENSKWPKSLHAFGAEMHNFTVVALFSDGQCSVGVSKRNPTDKEAKITGRHIAVLRAWRALNGKDPGYGRHSDPAKDRKRQRLFEKKQVDAKAAVLAKVLESFQIRLCLNLLTTPK